MCRAGVAFASPPTLLRVAVGLFAAWLLFGGAGSRSYAGCGDPVTAPGMTTTHFAEQLPPNLGGTETPTHECSGPHCRLSPPPVAPLSPPEVPPAPPPQDILAPISLVPPVDAVPGPRRTDDATLPQSRLGDLFRPPRF